MASLEYVIARWLRLRRLMVASMGAGRSCGGICPQPLPRQRGGLGPGDVLLDGRRFGGRRGGGGLAPVRGEFPGVLGVPVGLVVGADAPDGVGAVELQGVALGLVWGAAALVELLLAVPGYPDWHPTVRAQVLEAVLDRSLAPDAVARVVVAEGLLNSRTLLELWVCFGVGWCLWREGG